jgi:ubiquinol-cytochrome c reductase cytochrome b subunit
MQDFAKKVLDEHIPGGARFAYVFGSGLLFIFLLQAVTGVSLALYYTPTAETAHTSVAYITKQVEGGAFLRSLHAYGSSAMIIVLGLHFLQTFLYGSFKGRRELLWLSGALLSFLVLGMGFTGYLLPWDQKAYWATRVGTDIAGSTPFIGHFLLVSLRGGENITGATLGRFFTLHVLVLPVVIVVFLGAHFWMIRRHGISGRL